MNMHQYNVKKGCGLELTQLKVTNHPNSLDSAVDYF